MGRLPTTPPRRRTHVGKAPSATMVEEEGASPRQTVVVTRREFDRGPSGDGSEENRVSLIRALAIRAGVANADGAGRSVAVDRVGRCGR